MFLLFEIEWPLNGLEEEKEEEEFDLEEEGGGQGEEGKEGVCTEGVGEGGESGVGGMEEVTEVEVGWISEGASSMGINFKDDGSSIIKEGTLSPPKRVRSGVKRYKLGTTVII